MDEYRRHLRIWRMLLPLARPYLRRKFALSWEAPQVDGPMLLIANHSCSWDPLLVAVALDGRQIYYVASEHIFRLGFISRLLNWLVAPIARRKGTVGLDTVKACLKHLRAGHSVCLFAEGEACWTGESGHVFSATGKLAKTAGVSLVTVRIEGAYLSLPRWARRLRRGRVFVHPVHVYTPEELSAMSAGEINAHIDADIRLSAWECQAEIPVPYRGKGLAEGLERALYLCPGCGRIGTLRTCDDRITCDCGLDVHYTETGFFEPPQPFAQLAQWDAWQEQKLHARDFPHGEALFRDNGVTLTRIGEGHRNEILETGTLTQYEDAAVLGGHRFALAEIRSPAMVQAHLLLFSFGDDYYELRAEKGANLRKYLAVWKEREH